MIDIQCINFVCKETAEVVCCNTYIDCGKTQRNSHQCFNDIRQFLRVTIAILSGHVTRVVDQIYKIHPSASIEQQVTDVISRN